MNKKGMTLKLSVGLAIVTTIALYLIFGQPLVITPIINIETDGFLIKSISNDFSIVSEIEDLTFLNYIVTINLNKVGHYITGNINTSLLETNAGDETVEVVNNLEITLINHTEYFIFEADNTSPEPVYIYDLDTSERTYTCVGAGCTPINPETICQSSDFYSASFGGSVLGVEKWYYYCVDERQLGSKADVTLNGKEILIAWFKVKIDDKETNVMITNDMTSSEIWFDDDYIGTLFWSGKGGATNLPNTKNLVSTRSETLDRGNWHLGSDDNWEDYDYYYKELTEELKQNYWINSPYLCEGYDPYNIFSYDYCSHTGFYSYFTTLVDGDLRASASNLIYNYKEPAYADWYNGSKGVYMWAIAENDEQFNVYKPDLTFYIQANWLSIVISVGQPQINHIDDVTYRSGEHPNIRMDIENTGSSTGHFELEVDCDNPAFTLTDFDPVTVAPNSEETVYFSITEGGYNQDVCTTCEAKVYDLNWQNNFDLYDFDVCLEKAVDCIEGNTREGTGNWLQQCIDGEWFDIEQCEFGFEYISTGKVKCADPPSPVPPEDGICPPKTWFGFLEVPDILCWISYYIGKLMIWIILTGVFTAFFYFFVGGKK